MTSGKRANTPPDAAARGADVVLGFLFDPAFKTVVLIEKRKPAWMAGYRNGVGGKVALGETPLAAMNREFAEEAGVEGLEWCQFLEFDGIRPDKAGRFRLAVFYAVGDVSAARTMEKEPVVLVDVEYVLRDAAMTLGGTSWLLAMARAIATGREGCLRFEVRELELR